MIGTFGAPSRRANGPHYDVREWGAFGLNDRDETAAIQAAVDDISAPVIDPAFAIGSSAYDYTLRVWRKGVLVGTSATLAAAASNATIEAAIEAIDASLAGKVTVAASIYGSGNDATFSRSLGHIEMLSSYYYADPVQQGPIIYPRPMSAGPGGVLVLPGLHRVDDTIRVYAHGVRLETGLTMPGLFASAGVEAIRGGWYSNGIIWGGTDDSGPLVRFRGHGLFALAGVGFTGTLIAGSFPFTTAAATGLEITGVKGGEFGAIRTLEFKDDGMLLTTNPDWRADDYVDAGVTFTTFGSFISRQLVNAGNGFRVEGDPAGAANHYNNVFGMQHHVYNVGHGSVWGNSDNTLLGPMRGERQSGGTGYGVWLKATDTQAARSRFTIWDHMMPGAGGAYAEGTENGKTYPTVRNGTRTYNADPGGAGSPSKPIVGTGAEFWHLDIRSGNPEMVAAENPW